jgi:hypothetical protein
METLLPSVKIGKGRTKMAQSAAEWRKEMQAVARPHLKLRPLKIIEAFECAAGRIDIAEKFKGGKSIYLARLADGGWGSFKCRSLKAARDIFRDFVIWDGT